MKKQAELKALQFNYTAIRSLRGALRFASLNDDRREMHEICRSIVRALRDTMFLLSSPTENPPEPLIEYEKLKLAFRSHQEALKSMFSDDPNVSDADFNAVTKRAEDGTRALRRLAKNFLRSLKKYYPELLTTARRLALERMAGTKD